MTQKALSTAANRIWDLIGKIAVVAVVGLTGVVWGHNRLLENHGVRLDRAEADLGELAPKEILGTVRENSKKLDILHESLIRLEEQVKAAHGK